MTAVRQLHPDLVRVADALRDAGIVRAPGGDIQAARAYVDRANAFVTRDSKPLDFERMLTFAGPHGDVPVKLYWPDGAKCPGLLLYVHGGGFRQGTVTGWDAPMRMLARESGVAIASIDYRLAPEHRFPVAFEEVTEVIRQVISAGAIDGREVDGFAAGGDSAGANLALGGALTLREEGNDGLRHLMLLYGVYSRDLSSPSWAALDGFGLSAAAMENIWAGYLANNETDWRVQPLDADLAGLPPVRLTVGDLDPLIDQNRTLDTNLRKSGVETTLTVLPDVNHGVIRFVEVAPVVCDMVRVEGAALARAFA